MLHLSGFIILSIKIRDVNKIEYNLHINCWMKILAYLKWCYSPFYLHAKCPFLTWDTLLIQQTQFC